MRDQKLASERLFREKYGEVLAALLRYSGYQHFELAEEAVQTAFQRSLEKWSDSDMPQNPSGWLYTVARNAYLESLRRGETENRKLKQLYFDSEAQSPERTMLDEFVTSSSTLDDLAAMIFLCCNPELKPKVQICLTLKAACGFSVREIARALGMQEEAIKKTITRAKKRAAKEPDSLKEFNEDRIAAHFTLVLDTLYAMFNEGYAASSGDTQLRRDIAEEAIRLADIFVNAAFTPPKRIGELHALMALMLFQFARFDARSTNAGIPVRLQEQDRRQWNQEMLQTGWLALEASQTSEYVSSLHIEARIAAEHVVSPSFEETNWPTILSLYDQLLLYKDTPEVRLSRTVALRYVHGWEAAMAELDRLPANTVMRSFLHHAIRADLLESASKQAAALEAWEAARSFAPTTADRVFIDQKLKNLS